MEKVISEILSDEKLIREYTNYMERYDLEDTKILLKYEHTLRVYDIAVQIAESEKCTEIEIELVKKCAILHDIARAEQVVRYRTFSDNDSIDHALLGNQILFDENLNDNFVEEQEYYQLIKDVIYYHNKDVSKIPEELSDITKKILKIIRDADKIDICYVMLTAKFEDTYECTTFSGLQITPKIYDKFVNENVMLFGEMKNALDKLVGQLAFVFDLNFETSYQIFDNEGYLLKLYELYDERKIENREKFDKIFKVAKTYLEGRIK